jgi:PASTA domain
MAKVKVPLLGTVNKGTAVGVGIGGFTLAGYFVYREVKKMKAQSAAAAAAQSQVTASGYGYGMASGYGYGAYPYGFYGYGEAPPYGYGASGGFNATGYYGYGVPPTSQAVANTTNAQWAQAAINQLSGEGYDPQAVSAALGAYELGQPVTSAQQTIIQAAIGIEGDPPQSGSGGYPPAIHVQGTPGGGTGGGQTNTTVTVPNVVKLRGEAAKTLIQKAGLHDAQEPATTPKGKTTTVTSQSPKAGTKVAPGSTVTVKVKVS